MCSEDKCKTCGVRLRAVDLLRALRSHYPEQMDPLKTGGHLTEILVGMQPWKAIRELRAQLQECEEKWATSSETRSAGSK